MTVENGSFVDVSCVMHGRLLNSETGTALIDSNGKRKSRLSAHHLQRSGLERVDEFI